MKWTTDKPTVEGWYWAKKDMLGEMVIVNVTRLNDCLYYYDSYRNGIEPLYRYIYWSDQPIPEPEPEEQL